MPHPVFKDGTVAKGALAIGQTLRLGGFLMTACSAAASMMTSRVIESNLHVNSELAEQLDLMELSSLNELLDHMAALGVATDYDQIGLKPDLREINSPQATHHVVVVEEQCGNPSSTLKTNYVRIPDPSKPDSRGGMDAKQILNLESGIGPDLLENIQQPKLPNPETSRPLSLRLGGVPNLIPPAHPKIQAIYLKSGKSPLKQYITTGPDSSWLWTG